MMRRFNSRKFTSALREHKSIHSKQTRAHAKRTRTRRITPYKNKYGQHKKKVL